MTPELTMAGVMFDLLSTNVISLFSANAVRDLQHGPNKESKVAGSHLIARTTSLRVRWKRTLGSLLTSPSHSMLQNDEAREGGGVETRPCEPVDFHFGCCISHAQ